MVASATDLLVMMSWILFGIYLGYLALMGNSLKFGQIYILKAFASLRKEYHHQIVVLNLSLLVFKQSIMHTCQNPLKLELRRC